MITSNPRLSDWAYILPDRPGRVKEVCGLWDVQVSPPRGRRLLPALRASNKTENRNMRMGIVRNPGLALASGYGLRPGLCTVVPDGTWEGARRVGFG
jgi:hypothetical protein